MDKEKIKKRNRSKTIPLIRIIFIILLIVVAIFIIGKFLKELKPKYELKRVLEVEDIQNSNLPIKTTDKDSIAYVYENTLLNKSKKSLTLLNANVNFEKIKGKMLYARGNSYKNQVNVFQVKYRVFSSKGVNKKINKFTTMCKNYLGLDVNSKTEGFITKPDDRELKETIEDSIYKNKVLYQVSFESENKELDTNSNKDETKNIEENEQENNDKEQLPEEQEETLNLDSKYQANFYMSKGKLVCEFVRIY